MFETKGCRQMMCTDQEPQNVFETWVETEAYTQQGSPIQTCMINGDRRQMLAHWHGTLIQGLKIRDGEDACTQKRIHNPHMFETILDFIRNHIQDMLINGLQTDACTTTRKRNPNVFSTQSWILMHVRNKDPPTRHVETQGGKWCMYSTRNHYPNVFEHRL